MNAIREHRLAETFVELADTLVANFDVVDFTHVLANRCVELLDAAAVGLMLIDQHSQLRVIASSDEQSRVLELFELEADHGPCLECFRTGHQVADPDLRDADTRWPRFAAKAVEAGYLAVQAIPMRLRGETIGVLNLFRQQPGALDETLLRTGQALADVATIGLLHERAVRHHQILAEQLQGALNSRVVIEQAKGLLSERFNVDMPTAFVVMRKFARRTNRKLSDVAQDVVSGRLETRELVVPMDKATEPEPT
ncbi:GAF and ANTAR domain-containing protein [Stackebrandtia nassauensis]|uniref:ANTAR domain-containing protein n=1 Tax=Stackebrandtia nassauensis (strain DSM 44728 / CIP 108903 / NRRL B-16338 / NBRC 102104 / LLR-40K-21) TaxID=446470 RepID=D3Q8S9_STANL|nr:GAF and ANTAR domain-containing protein [Stackebrandtia nassauensis]ADD44521.1 ANTAR domain protein with unknown sensor [Stackebrandtia nassauensis DSM 44728]